MRVLWFAGGTTSYSPQESKNETRYKASGWVSQLRTEITKHKEIELGICYNGGVDEVFEEYGVTYYSISNHKRTFKNKLQNFLNPNDESSDEIYWSFYINKFKNVINTFKPDVIQVFGSEVYLQLSAISAKNMNIPCVLHIQGFISFCTYIVQIPGMSKWNYTFGAGSLRSSYGRFQALMSWKKDCHREKTILKSVPHVVGRTEWDRHGASLLAPQAKYHYGSEMMRPSFYLPSERTLPKETVISTTISSATYKGYDVILKIADILKNTLHLSFTWNVFGNVNPIFAEKLTGLRHKDLNVVLKGIATAEQLRTALLNSTLYVHPSYIENSPNSVCEPQMLGIPVVASNVGGTSSLIEHGITGYLYPITDPFSAAFYINELIHNRETNIRIGREAKRVAQKRHNLDDITNGLIDIYKSIIKYE